MPENQHELAIVMRLKDELTRELRRAAQNAEVSGQNMGRSIDVGARTAVRGLQSIARGMTAVTAAASAADRNVVGIGASLVASFAAGGPAGLAIAGAGTLLGLVVGHLRDVGREAEEARAAFEREMKGIRDATDQVWEGLAKRRGQDPLREQLASLRSQIRELEGEVDKFGIPTYVGFKTEQMKQLEDLREKEWKLAGLVQAREAATNKEIEERIGLLRDASEFRKKLAGVENEAAGFSSEGASPEKVGEFRRASIAKLTQEEMSRLEGLVRDFQKTLGGLAADGTIQSFTNAALKHSGELKEAIKRSFEAASSVAPDVFSEGSLKTLLAGVDEATKAAIANNEALVRGPGKEMISQLNDRIALLRSESDQTRELLRIDQEIRAEMDKISELRRRGATEEADVAEKRLRELRELRRAAVAEEPAANAGAAGGEAGTAMTAEEYARAVSARLGAMRHESQLIQEVNDFARQRLQIERETVIANAEIEASGWLEADKQRARELVQELQRLKVATLDVANAKAQAARAQPFRDELGSLRMEVERLGIRDPIEQQLYDLDREFAQRKQDVAAAFDAGDIDQGLRSELDAILATWHEAWAQEIRDAGDPFLQTVRGVGPQVTDAITQMAVTGFKNWEDIARSALMNISGQFLNLGLNTLGKTLLPGLWPAAMGGVFTVGEDPRQLPVRHFAGGGIAGSPELILVGEGTKREAVVPLPDGRSIPVEMRGGAAGGLNLSLTVNVGGGGGFLDLPVEDQIRLIVAHVERGLQGRYAQAIAARVRGALV